MCSNSCIDELKGSQLPETIYFTVQSREDAHSVSSVNDASFIESGIFCSGLDAIMQEYVDNIGSDFAEILAQGQQVDWRVVIGFVIGAVVFSRLCASGGMLRRLVGVGGLAVLVWVLWRYAAEFINL